MKLKNLLNWAERNESVRVIIDFYELRFLGEVLAIYDIIEKDEDIESNKEFYAFFKKELLLRGTEQFLNNPEYPRPNYAGFVYPEFLEPKSYFNNERFNF